MRNKEKAAAEIGMACRVLHFGSDVGEKELLDVIAALNDDENVNGIIIQQPLPSPLMLSGWWKPFVPRKTWTASGL